LLGTALLIKSRPPRLRRVLRRELASTKPQTDFSRGCAGRRTADPIFATHPPRHSRIALCLRRGGSNTAFCVRRFYLSVSHQLIGLYALGTNLSKDWPCGIWNMAMWQMHQHSLLISLHTYSRPPSEKAKQQGELSGQRKKTSQGELSRGKGNKVKNQTYIASTIYSILCPCCGINQLHRSPQGMAHCTRCNRSISREVLETLEQIVALPGAIGSHVCECGHPEMRRLPDGVFCCPSCGSEVLPLSDSPIRSQ
jgi:ribosomal protein L37AE/L43A